MAPVLPGARSAMISWFRQRIAQWAANAAALGVDPAQIVSLSTLLDTAEADEESAFQARNASKSATVVYYNSSDQLRDFGAEIIKAIKLQAESTNDPNVYALADVPPPAAPSPLGPPATPKDLTATLNTAGEITVEWDGSRAGGTSFTIQRSTSGITGPWTIVGTSEERLFKDTAVPRGFDAVSYRVIAARSGGASGPSSAVSVLFGNTNSEQSSGGEGLTLAA